MAKYTNVLSEKSTPSRRPGSGRGVRRLVLLVALISSPFVYEGANVCRARWASMLGTNTEVSTPVWDAVRDAYASASDEWRYRVGRGIEPGRWSAGMAIPAVILIALGSSFFLRGTTR